MRFLIRHLLLLGVILGLAGQGVAFAAQPCAEMQQQHAAAMAGPMADMSDCMMGQEEPGKGSAPCKDMTPGCLSMTGCASLAAFDAPSISLSVPTIVAVAALWPATPVLIGRNIAPDPDPPSFLG